MKKLIFAIVLSTTIFNCWADDATESKPGFWSRGYTEKFDNTAKKQVKQSNKFQNGSDHLIGLYNSFKVASVDELPDLVEEALMLLFHSTPGSSKADKKQEFTKLANLNPKTLKAGENAYGFRKYDPAKDAEVRQYQVMMAGFCGAHLKAIEDYSLVNDYINGLYLEEDKRNDNLAPNKDAYKKHIAYMLRFMNHGANSKLDWLGMPFDDKLIHQQTFDEYKLAAEIGAAEFVSIYVDKSHLKFTKLSQQHKGKFAESDEISDSEKNFALGDSYQQIAKDLIDISIDSDSNFVKKVQDVFLDNDDKVDYTDRNTPAKPFNTIDEPFNKRKKIYDSLLKKFDDVNKTTTQPEELKLIQDVKKVLQFEQELQTKAWHTARILFHKPSVRIDSGTRKAKTYASISEIAAHLPELEQQFGGIDKASTALNTMGPYEELFTKAYVNSADLIEKNYQSKTGNIKLSGYKIDETASHNHSYSFTFSLLPKSFYKLTHLKMIDLREFCIPYDVFEEEIGKFKDLEELIIERVYWLHTFSKSLASLPNLKSLTLDGLANRTSNGIKELPPEIGKMKKLTTLKICGSELNTLPNELFELSNLKTLNIGYNKKINNHLIEFKSVPVSTESFYKLKQLSSLYIPEILLESKDVESKDVESIVQNLFQNMPTLDTISTTLDGKATSFTRPT